VPNEFPYECWFSLPASVPHVVDVEQTILDPNKILNCFFSASAEPFSLIPSSDLKYSWLFSLSSPQHEIHQFSQEN
jgi:hypothetical protein